MSHKLKDTGCYWRILALQHIDFYISYCFSFTYHGSHNRLVAGSSPAGATKFYLLNQHIEASFQGGFFVYPSNPPSLFLSSYKNLKFFC